LRSPFVPAVRSSLDRQAAVTDARSAWCGARDERRATALDADARHAEHDVGIFALGGRAVWRV